MKSFLLLFLSLTTGCEAAVDACESGWVRFTCKHPKPCQNYTFVQLVSPNAEIKVGTNQTDVWEHKERLSVYKGNQNLKVSIKHLEENDFGKYRCEFYWKTETSDFKRRNVELKRGDDLCQTAKTQTASGSAPINLTCDYRGDKFKYFCKEDDFLCEDIVTSSSLSNGTFTLLTLPGRFQVSISSVSSRDSGVYWCGVQSANGRHRYTLQRIQLNVEEAAGGGSGLTAVVVSVVCVVVAAAAAAILLYLYKRSKPSVNRTKGAPTQEDSPYAEIQELPLAAGQGTAVKTVYTTISSMPSAPSHYYEIDFVDSCSPPSSSSTVSSPQQL